MSPCHPPPPPCSGLSEVSLAELSAESRRTTVVTALRALKKFSFYPEQVRGRDVVWPSAVLAAGGLRHVHVCSHQAWVAFNSNGLCLYGFLLWILRSKLLPCGGHCKVACA